MLNLDILFTTVMGFFKRIFRERRRSWKPEQEFVPTDLGGVSESKVKQTVNQEETEISWRR